ncbi:hypothetical protein HaLaN_04990, partial [Haematococcus lacustris]
MTSSDVLREKGRAKLAEFKARRAAVVKPHQEPASRAHPSDLLVQDPGQQVHARLEDTSVPSIKNDSSSTTTTLKYTSVPNGLCHQGSPAGQQAEEVAAAALKALQQGHSKAAELQLSSSAASGTDKVVELEARVADLQAKLRKGKASYDKVKAAGDGLKQEADALRQQ